MERNPDRSSPRLLVSVRNKEEAHEAIAGGCDILDVKDPQHGSLGAATASVISEIADVGHDASIPVTAALGECAEWQELTQPLNPEAISGSGLQFVKLGLAAIGHREDWSTQWRNVTALCSQKLGPGTRHVAVIYADWEAARAPHPQSILDAISERRQAGSPGANFAGVLIDTFEKSSGRLLDAMSLELLHEVREQTAQLGMFLALAGRLNEESLPQLVEFSPDIVAVRSAACRGEDRNSSVDRDAVSQFREAMQSHFEPLVKTAPVNGGVRHA
jgi:(5-formylfuran-3-yl)methyl phosphate synthase